MLERSCAGWEALAEITEYGRMSDGFVCGDDREKKIPKEVKQTNTIKNIPDTMMLRFVLKGRLFRILTMLFIVSAGSEILL